MKDIELRDYIAVEAMKTMLSKPDVKLKLLSEASYLIADAMLKERDKNNS